MSSPCKIEFDDQGKFKQVTGDLPGAEGVRVDYPLQPIAIVAISAYYQHQTEFALVQEYEWHDGMYYQTERYWLFSGEAYSMNVSVKFDDPLNGVDGFENLYHTHPSGKTTPSSADVDDLVARHYQFGQIRSGIIPIGHEPVQIYWYDIHTIPVD